MSAIDITKVRTIRCGLPVRNLADEYGIISGEIHRATGWREAIWSANGEHATPGERNDFDLIESEPVAAEPASIPERAAPPTREEYAAWQASVAHLLPAPAAVRGTAPRDLAADISEAERVYHTTFIDGTSEVEYIAAELTRLGWVHSSQATGGGLSGEARVAITEALDERAMGLANAKLYRFDHDAHTVERVDTAPTIAAIDRARAELAALPVRGVAP